MIKLLLKYGANPVTYNFLNRSPLIKAAYLGKHEILAWLLDIDTSLIDLW